MDFVELPDGRLINADRIEEVVPMGGDFLVLKWVGGRKEQIGGKNADALRKHLAPPKQRKRT